MTAPTTGEVTGEPCKACGGDGVARGEDGEPHDPTGQGLRFGDCTSCGGTGYAPKVTGETITDEQIDELRGVGDISLDTACDALMESRRYQWETKQMHVTRMGERSNARNRCAAAWNARHKEVDRG